MKKGLKVLNAVFFSSIMFLSGCGNNNNYVSQGNSESTVLDESAYNHLSSPKKIDFNSETLLLKWDAVSGATKYEVNVNGEVVDNSIKGDTTSYTFDNDFFSSITTEEILISVRAFNENGVPSSYKSIVFSHSSHQNSSAFIYQLIDNENIAITGTSSTITPNDYEDLVIDSVISGIKVSKIAPGAFLKNTSLKKITLPDTIEEIGNEAFKDCKNLKSINFGSNLKIIGDSAFDSNYVLGDSCSIVIPASVTYIGTNAFYKCSKIKSLSFEKGINLEEINENSFTGCSEAELEIPASVKIIHASAFLENKSLVALTFEEGSKLEKIEDNAFKTNTKLSGNLILPDTVTALGNNAFDSSKLSNVYVSHSTSLNSIGDDAFSNNKSLAFFGYNDSKNKNGFEIISSLEKIGDNAFENTIINSFINVGTAKLSYIGANAFKTTDKTGKGINDISALNSIESLTFIDSTAFTGSPYFKGQAGNEIIIAGILLQAKDADKDSSNKDLVVSNNVKYISNSVFNKMTQYQSVTLPDSLIGIYDSAFSGCTGIKNISFPASLKVIGASAFYNNALETISFTGNNLTEINENAFKVSAVNKNKINQVNLPSSIELIGAGAFENNNSITQISAGSNLKTIGKGAFSQNTALTSFSFAGESNIESIGENAFYNCKALSTFDLGNTITTISKSAFEKCAKLDLTLPNSIITIEDNAFKDSGISNVNLGSNIIYLGSNAFANCTNLSTLFIDDSAFADKDNSIIRKNTFSGCSNLTTINIPNCVELVEDLAFDGCNNLETITCNAIKVQSNAFKDSKWEKSFTDGLVVIGNKILKYNGNEKEISITEGIEIINSSCFENSNLDTVNLPQSIKEIEQSAFANCKSLKTISFTGNCNLEIIGENAFARCYLLNEVDLAKTNVKVIANNAFAYDNELCSVTFPNGLESIGDYAFFETSVTSLSFPQSLQSIGEYAFANCGKTNDVTSAEALWSVNKYSIVNVTFDTTSAAVLNNIGAYAFYNNNIEGKVSLPNTELDLNNYCFANSLKLEEFEIKSNYIVRSNILAGSNKLNSLSLPGKIKVANLFGGYSANVPSSLKNIIIEEGSKEITNDFLNGCGNIMSVQLPSDIEAIGESAFFGCRSLKSIDLSSVKTIADGAFMGCINLDDITFGENISYIGNKAFMSTGYLLNKEDNVKFVIINDILVDFNNIDNETEIIIPDNVKIVAGGSFSGCNELTKITVGNSVTLLCNGAFDGCYSLSSLDLSKVNNNIVEIELNIFDGLTNFSIDVSNNMISKYNANVYWKLYKEYFK